jgi:hypothetical protein
MTKYILLAFIIIVVAVVMVFVYMRRVAKESPGIIGGGYDARQGTLAFVGDRSAWTQIEIAYSVWYPNSRNDKQTITFRGTGEVTAELTWEENGKIQSKRSTLSIAPAEFEKILQVFIANDFVGIDNDKLNEIPAVPGALIPDLSLRNSKNQVYKISYYSLNTADPDVAKVKTIVDVLAPYMEKVTEGL